jgi:hypothetical protein
MRKNDLGSSEPLFYIALVVKGTEKQYLSLLKYLGSHNGSKVIYQCKSLTYLRVSRDDGVRCQIASPEVQLETTHQKGDKP